LAFSHPDAQLISQCMHVTASSKHPQTKTHNEPTGPSHSEPVASSSKVQGQYPIIKQLDIF